MRKHAAALLTIVAFCTACQKFAEGRQTFRELVAIRDQIAAQFHERVVDVTLSKDGAMTVKFIDSPLNAATHEAKQKRADEVAAFVVDHYKHHVESVSTDF